MSDQLAAVSKDTDKTGKDQWMSKKGETPKSFKSRVGSEESLGTFSFGPVAELKKMNAMNDKSEASLPEDEQ